MNINKPLLVFIFFQCVIYANTTVYIDGGATSTKAYIFSEKNELVHVRSALSSNLNARSTTDVKSVLTNLLQGIPPDTVIYAGFAGAGSEKNKNILKTIFQELGYKKTSISTDISLLMDLVNEDCIILIAGSGSVCFANKDSERKQFGGLGWKLGDEGSGFWIGLRAIKKALEEEQEMKISTALTKELKKHFKVENLKTLVPSIYDGNISQQDISSIAALVFSSKEDALASEIIEEGAAHLTTLLQKALDWQGGPAKVILYGSLFKDKKYSENIISSIDKDIKIYNCSDASFEDFVLNQYQDNLLVR